jgi:cephalosporin hydroxylase
LMEETGETTDLLQVTDKLVQNIQQLWSDFWWLVEQADTDVEKYESKQGKNYVHLVEKEQKLVGSESE